MLPQDTSSLALEYLRLWEAHGLDFLEGLTNKKDSIEALLNSAPVETQRVESLESIREELGDCRRCGLCEARKQIVFGQGNPKARLMFVGEGPGADEDEQGLAFVGQSGQLLTKILEAMKTAREEVFIANIVKCRPPGNRMPEPAEVEQCLPFLQRQVRSVSPQVIVALGSTAASTLLGTSQSLSTLRGKPQPLPWLPDVMVVPTFHPAYLLRTPDAKRLVWEDMKMVLQLLGSST